MLSAMVVGQKRKPGARKKQGQGQGKGKELAIKKVKKPDGMLLTQVQKQRALLEEWIDSMVPELDYDASQWSKTLKTTTASGYFGKYNDRFSKIAKAKGATVYFASIGACDGTQDYTIREQYLKNPHWDAVFVEPVSNNVVELKSYLESMGAKNRSLVIQAAATSTCIKPTLDIERPLYEEKNKDTPHWLRRQIASIIPKDRTAPRQGWTTEKVNIRK